jgi:hypothetical protein
MNISRVNGVRFRTSPAEAVLINRSAQGSLMFTYSIPSIAREPSAVGPRIALIALLLLAATLPAKTHAADTSRPNVTITAPVSGATVSGTITVRASASDNVGVAGVQFKYNGVNLGVEDTTAPYSVATNTTTVPNGTYILTAVARDAAGNVRTSTPVTITVANKPTTPDTAAPSVPAGLSGTAISSDQIKLTWNASTDNVGVTGYYVYLNDVALATTSATSYTHAGLSPGATYNYRVSAFDAIPNHSAWTAPVTVSLQQAPYSGTPIAVPGSFEAENFDRGGEGIGYHDNIKGNAGGQYRTAEDVDIIVSGDSAGGGFLVNNFETGEWLAYTINVAASALYDIEIRASSTFTSSAFHVEIDGTNISGPVAVPSTGSWTTFQWVGKKGLALTTGRHVLKIVSDQQYFNLNSVRVTPTVGDITPPAVGIMSPAAGSTVSGMMTVTANASDNVGVAGVQFKYNGSNLGAEVTTAPYSVSSDTTTIADGSYTLTAVARDAAGNLTNSTPVIVRVANAPPSDSTPPAVNLTAPASGASVSGMLAVRANASDDVGIVGVQFKHDGANLGAEVTTAPYTVNADTTTVPNGSHTLTAVARDAAGNLTTAAPVTVNVANGGTPPPPPGSIVFSCLFPNAPTNCGFFEQAKAYPRASIVDTGRAESRGVRLHTEVGDDNVAGSGTSERNDISLSQAASDGYEGREHWWAHSILFPSDYVNPPAPAPGQWNFGVVFDFHNSGSGPWQANFHIDVMPDVYGGLRFRGYGGINSGDGEFIAPIGQVVRNVWYDFVYHVKWSSGPDGFFDAWVRIGNDPVARKVLTHRGPTLYAGQGIYLKAANYHSPFGLPSSVIHSRILRGTTSAAVSLVTLEGVLQ